MLVSMMVNWHPLLQNQYSNDPSMVSSMAWLLAQS